MDGEASLASPDIRKALQRITGIAENDPFQKTEFPLEKTFETRFDQMAAVERKVPLGMRDPHGRAHEPNGKGSCRVKEFFRDIRAEKTDGDTVLGEMGGDFPIIPGSDLLKLLYHFQLGGLHFHKNLC
jgi:hypothetical protein